MPKEANGTKFTLELYVRSDGVVFDDDFEEVGTAIQISKGHGDIKDGAEIIKRLEEKEKEPLYQHDMDDWWVGIIDAETEVNKAPTILGAEERNENTISLRWRTM